MACVSGNKISKGAIVDLDYSSRVERLAVTFEDGSTGLCHTTDASMKGLNVNQWINEGRIRPSNDKRDAVILSFLFRGRELQSDVCSDWRLCKHGCCRVH